MHCSTVCLLALQGQAGKMRYKDLRTILKAKTTNGIDSVLTRVSRLRTPVAPGHDPRQLVAAHEGSAGVALAGVLAAGVQPGADHRVRDVGLAVGVPAGRVRNHGDGHLGL